MIANKQEKSNLWNAQFGNPGKPVECLGMMFDDEEARRAYFLDKLREKLQDPEFRKIEGFPIGSDEDILALSDPPYYTACPNPFIKDFVNHFGKPYHPEQPYSREPFAADVSEGKGDPIYNAHTYHTKVPHRAIMRYILHYTEPGDVVLDGFSGTGMTGVAAQYCGNRNTLASLRYETQPDGKVLDEGRYFSKLGSRRAILNDLSPAASYISYSYNTPIDVAQFEYEAARIIREVQEECGWLYLTLHSPTPAHVEKAVALLKSNTPEQAQRLPSMDPTLPLVRINYTVWSDVFVCSECAHEVVFWEAAVKKSTMEVQDSFPCPNCQVSLTKRGMDRATETKYDTSLDQVITQGKQLPVLISYSVGSKRFEKRPDAFDLALIDLIGRSDIPYWFPSQRMPEGDESRRNDDAGITHVHHFFTRRNLWMLAALRARCERTTLLAFQSIVATLCSRLVRYNMGKRGNGPLSGTLYISSLNAEAEVLKVFQGKVKDFATALAVPDYNAVTNQSATNLQMPTDSVDYIFTDPPFGSNLMYSELNYLWEVWLKVLTDNREEAIENRTQGKGLPEYQELMTRCFEQYYRVLKPGRWMTVEFHNSKNSIWASIQEALLRAGFVVADVRTLDKQQGTFKQVTSGGAVKQDLVISCYKPNAAFEERFKLEAGTPEGAWDFVRAHLRQLPVFVAKEDKGQLIAERHNYLLFDRMVAFHVQRGLSVPLSASEFYAGLEQRFAPRDGMYFLHEQVAEYDKKLLTVRELQQLQLFITDEYSAIQWLRQQLNKKPYTFQEIHPHFMRELGGWQKYEKSLELLELLEQNFLRYYGNGPIPSQLLPWMKQSEHLRGKIREIEAQNGSTEEDLDTDDPQLITAAKDRWYIPDPNKAGDLVMLREKSLLKEFEEYRSFKGRQLKVFRLEAVRAGFKRAWQERDYATIIEVAQKVPDAVLQEDPKLLMWYDQALTRSGAE